MKAKPATNRYYRARAPLRISFCGGGTDVSPYPEEHGGCVLSATINHYAYASLRPRRDSRLTLASLDYDLVAKYDHPARLKFDGQLDLLKAAVKALRVKRGADLWTHSDAPPGSGLGASSTLMVALIGVLREWLKVELTPYEIAELAFRVERIDLKLAGGRQDQYAAAFGGLNLIRFHPDESVSVDPVICDPAVLAQFEASTLVFYTGHARSAASVLAEQSAHTGEHRLLLRRMAALSFDLKKELESGRLEGVGPILDENWRLKRQISAGVSNAQIDDWYATGLAAGATGGKLLGAGRGGFLMLFAPPDLHLRISRALSDLKPVRFRFDRAGAQIVFYQPGEGS